MGVADPSKPLKVTLAWADAPGAVGANPALVNNLDLTVSQRRQHLSGQRLQRRLVADRRRGRQQEQPGERLRSEPGRRRDDHRRRDQHRGRRGALQRRRRPTRALRWSATTARSSPTSRWNVTPGSQDICAPSDAVYTIDVGSVLGYSDPVTLSASGQPAGTTASFSINPVTPPGASTLTIGNTGAAAAGSYSIDVVGVAPTSTHTSTVGLNVFTAAPAAPALASPANGALNVGLTPTLTWNARGAGRQLQHRDRHRRRLQQHCRLCQWHRRHKLHHRRSPQHQHAVLLACLGGQHLRRRRLLGRLELHHAGRSRRLRPRLHAVRGLQRGLRERSGQLDR